MFTDPVNTQLNVFYDIFDVHLPGEHPVHLPGEHPVHLPGGHPVHLPGEHPVHLPGEHPVHLPGEHPFIEPNNISYSTPSFNKLMNTISKKIDIIITYMRDVPQALLLLLLLPAAGHSAAGYCGFMYSSSLSLICSCVSALQMQWLFSPKIPSQHGESYDTLQWLKNENGLVIVLKLDSDNPIFVYVYIITT